MDPSTDALRTEIDAFRTRKGWSGSYFGWKAVNNARLYERLEAGGTVTLKTAERVKNFMREHT